MSRPYLTRVVLHVIGVSFAIIASLHGTEGWSQSAKPATSHATGKNQAAPAPAPASAPATAPAPAPGAAPATASAPEVDSVVIFSGAPSTPTTGTASQRVFILEMDGKNFNTIKDLSSVRVIPFPSTGVTSMTTPFLGSSDGTSDGTKLFAQFSAPSNYTLEQVALSLTGSSALTFNTGAAACDFQKAVVVTPQIVPFGQSKTKYGDGIGSNFYVVQISIVNKCSMPIDVPLAGIRIVANGNQNDSPGCPTSTTDSNLVPFSLDHLTAMYSEDRKLTGHRAIYFNILQAAATIGSGIEPFFGHGFTQGVAILGGAFTTASKEVFIDMSAEQLQNITSQSFGVVEQVPAGGSLQKFIFVRRIPKCVKKQNKESNTLDSNLTSGSFSVYYDLLPASSAAPQTQNAKAVPPQS